MRSLLPLTVYCISLLSFQLLALPVDHLERNRLDLLKKLHALREEDQIFTPELDTDPASPSDSSPPPAVHDSTRWLPGFLRDTPSSSDMKEAVQVRALAWARGATGLETQRRPSRGRRHAHQGSKGGHHHHAQLMRVGCVLGTCQVQNLSHRLYQLIGQSGREDSSPINPRSPHSYG
ncbi:protein ADM2a [Osmerus eperlanus]|uniref:protein ADM2a n=1 Tax=Osmerus eperlanus TaxID=29151 RepID=UPI002E15B4B3